MRILLSGIGGQMGAEVMKLVSGGYRDAEVVFGGDKFASLKTEIPWSKTFDQARTDVDAVVDFSNHEMTGELLEFCVKKQLPLVIATTGQTDDEKEQIRKASEGIPVFFASNYSLGVAALAGLAKKAAAMFPDADVEIVETHHRNKLDAPSGTALAIADAVREVRTEAEVTMGRSGFGKRKDGEIGIQAVRMGSETGTHEIFFAAGGETVSIRHEAQDRGLFADGALKAACWLAGQKPGLYSMEDLVG